MGPLSEAWQSVRDRAVHAYQASIRADPLRFRRRVEAFVAALAGSRSRLDRIRRLLADVDDSSLRARARALEQRHADLASGLGVVADSEDTVGLAPVGLVVAGTVIGVAGIAWSLVGYQYALNLREQTALLEQELVARVQASRSGVSLAPSTLSTPASAPEPARRMGLLLLGGLTVAAGAIAVPLFLGRS